MTFEEAKLKRIEHLKIDIRNRLHKYNPNKYPKPKMYSSSEAIDVSLTLYVIPKIHTLFERDNFFYNQLKRKQ